VKTANRPSVQAVVVPDVCCLCGEIEPDYRAAWLENNWVHKDCDREAQRDEERRQMRQGHNSAICAAPRSAGGAA